MFPEQVDRVVHTRIGVVVKYGLDIEGRLVRCTLTERLRAVGQCWEFTRVEDEDGLSRTD